MGAIRHKLAGAGAAQPVRKESLVEETATKRGHDDRH